MSSQTSNQHRIDYARGVSSHACGARCQLALLLGLLAALLVIIAAAAELLGPWPTESLNAHRLLIALPVVGLLMLALLSYLLWRDFLSPLIQLHEWAQRMRAGSLNARLAIPHRKEFATLAEDINSLALMLEQQSLETEAQLQAHTDHITQKNRDLEMLYTVASSVNLARDIDELLKQFVGSLRDVVHARAASVRLLSDDQNMLLAASIGIPDEIIEAEQSLPAAHCACGHAALAGQIIWQESARRCSSIVEVPLFEGEDLVTASAPIRYRDHTLGAFSLFISRDRLKRQNELDELFMSLGQHLGMAIEKARLDEEANRLSIMAERANLSHELHDSLAQTLAGLRFELRVLRDKSGDELNQPIERIENIVEEANTELRELIGQFRAPIDSRGLLPAIEQVVQRFRDDTGLHIILQDNWGERRLPAAAELHVLRIVQECLANIRKHAEASTVRVLLADDGDGSLRVLVEDDGVGLPESPRSGGPGEHIGLGIMRERARRIDGELDVDSEPGEGTRIELTFRPQNGGLPQPIKTSEVA
jgi:two-component system nitrate/nitrite sensor histidine kinase NarX